MAVRSKESRHGGTPTPSERTTARRADLIAKGYAQKNWLLSPAALRSLERVCNSERCTETEAVERALAQAAREGLSEITNEQLLKLVGRRLKPDGVR